ncbi:MAG: hypothetical protein SFW09_11830 [Hyphomicrobiaceae bacterium]|nr:hypothetical protein [Hyphomicrobiaceae bacterium]
MTSYRPGSAVRRAALSAMLVVLCLPAPAAGQVPAVGCEVADFNIVLKLYIPLAPDGSGSPGAGGMQGSLEIFHQKVPKERRLWSLDGKRPAQYWNHDGEFKLQLLLGSGDDRISLVLDTRRRQDTGEHMGGFRLETGAVKVTGRLACTIG